MTFILNEGQEETVAMEWNWLWALLGVLIVSALYMISNQLGEILSALESLHEDINERLPTAGPDDDDYT